MKCSMFRFFIITLFALPVTFSAQAQIAYTLHTLTAGESLSGLAKTYHTTVGDIMRLNGMHTDSKLVVGEKIKIPATSSPVPTAAVATEPATSKEASTHTVQSGESLYRISQKYKIPVEKLMALNKITAAGDIKVGQVLLLSEGTAPAAVKESPSAVTTTPAATPAQNNTEKKGTEQPESPVDTIVPAGNTSSAPARQQPAIENTAANTTTNNSGALPVSSSGSFAPTGGFFTPQFRQNVEGRNEETRRGTSMTFKSASGWADKKFYVLMNDAPPGSIVRLANGNTAVFAKVLWNLGSQKENEGLDFRISTAAAAALNITEERFDLTVTYFQ